MNEYELTQRIVAASLRGICEHGRRAKSCVDCENTRLTARVETLEVLECAFLVKVQKWDASMELLEQSAAEAEQQAAATIQALQAEIGELKQQFVIELLKTPEAARYLRLSPRTLEAYRCQGVGPPFVSLGGAGPYNTVRYSKRELVKWIADRCRTSTTETDCTGDLDDAAP